MRALAVEISQLTWTTWTGADGERYTFPVCTTVPLSTGCTRSYMCMWPQAYKSTWFLYTDIHAFIHEHIRE